MDIGLKIKETLSTNDLLIAKINTAFSNAILEAEKHGIDASEIYGTNNALVAMFDGYQIAIPLSTVIHELKSEMKRFAIEDIKNLSDNFIIDAVNKLIIEKLQL